MLKEYIKKKIEDFLDIKSISRATEERFFGASSSNKSSATLATPKDFLNSFQLFNYVGTCVATIARDVSRMEWKLLNYSGEEVSNRKIEAILAKPFNGLSYRQLIQQCMVHLLLDGNCFILLNPSNFIDKKNRAFSELVPINPSLVDIYDDSLRIIRSIDSRNSYGVNMYRCMISNSYIDIFPENIQQAKILGPHNIIRGMGVIQQNAPSLDADRFTTLYNNMFFQNGAKTNVMISPKDEEGYNPDSWKKAIDEMTKRYTGWENQSKPWFLPMGVDVHPLNLSQNDMQFIEQLKLTRENVNSFFKIPPIISQLYEHSKYDSADQQLESYYSITLPGWSSPLEEAITSIIQRIDPTLSFVFVMPKKLSSQDARDMFDRGVISGNEYRANYGITPIYDNKQLENRYMLMSYMPVDSMDNQPTQTEQTTPTENASKNFDIPVKKKEVTGRQYLIHAQARKTKKVIEKRMADAINSYYSALEKKVLANLLKSDKYIDIKTQKSNNQNEDDVFDFKEEVKQAKKLGKNMIMAGVVIGINDINKMVGSKVDSTTKNSRLVLVVEKLATNYASRTIDSRRNELRDILSKSVEDGAPLSELKGRIQDYFDELKSKDGWMATRIARTEASYAWDQAAKLGYEDIGVKKCDVVGCEDSTGDCNAKDVSMDEIDNLDFHPNHTGTIVPA